MEIGLQIEHKMSKNAYKVVENKSKFYFTHSSSIPTRNNRYLTKRNGDGALKLFP